MYQPQNFLPQASKTFASAPGQLPRDVVSVPRRKGPLRGNSASRWSRNICSRYRIRTSIPVTSTSAMCPGTAISRLAVIVTAFPKRCVVSRYRYEYRWMTSCGSTVMRNWWPHIASVRHRLAGRQCRSIMPRSGSRSVRWNIDH